jgi:4-alpha-glucanotransferase
MRVQHKTTAVPAIFNKDSGEDDILNKVDPTLRLDPERLDRLLHAYGIGSEFIDFSGNVIHTPLLSRLHIFECMGFKVASANDLERLLRERELAVHGRWLDPVVLAEEGKPATLVFRSHRETQENTIHWVVILEDGSSREGESIPATLPELEQYELWGQAFRSCSLTLAPLPVGYHQLHLKSGSASASSDLIVAPVSTWQPPALAKGGRLWGLSTQLYTVRSGCNWGMGDFGDLRELSTFAATEGADFILLNPLHSPDLRYPENASPYSPDDRRFLNPLYIHLPGCEDYQAEAVGACVSNKEFQAALHTARQCKDVDYATVARLKLQVLELMYESFSQRFVTDLQHLQFHHFVTNSGKLLVNFAEYQAERFSSEQGALKDPEFHCYLQWLARKQLLECQLHAKELGMRIGLVQDLAVGSIADGCEVQSSKSQYCLQARIGAPPDNFNPDGQNWGLPPLLPDSVVDTRCRNFRDLLQANMRSCGALRIDHVMSLMRLWWCPDDGSNATGAYVYYPVDLLFAILKLESQRYQCAVIGEDLGVVPPEIRSYLESALVYSNCVFYFEKYDGWHFRKPEHYKHHALAMVANHDVPPLACWWSEEDLAIRLGIGMIADAAKYQDEVNWRRGEKGQILVWLLEQGLLPDSWSVSDNTRILDDELKTALARACARIVSSLVSIQLDDLAGADTPVNIPGTHTEYANWRRKLPLETTAIFNSTIAKQITQAMREGRNA